MSAASRVDPVAFIAGAELRHQLAAASLVGAMQRRETDAESAALRLGVALGQHLTPSERAIVSGALWLDLDLLPPHPTLVASPREARTGDAA